MKKFCDMHHPVTEVAMVTFSLSVGAVVSSVIYLRMHGYFPKR